MNPEFMKDTELWENRELGSSAEHVAVATDEEMDEFRKALEPNKTTIKAIRNMEDGIVVTRHKNKEELYESLFSDDQSEDNLGVLTLSLNQKQVDALTSLLAYVVLDENMSNLNKQLSKVASTQEVGFDLNLPCEVMFDWDNKNQDADIYIIHKDDLS